jgi:hypothetical protein
MADFDDDKHPRDERGRFAGGSALGKWAASKTGSLAGKLLATAQREGGFSYHPEGPNKDRTPTSGIMVSLPVSAGHNHVVDIKTISESATREQARKEVKGQIVKWLEKTLPAIKGKPDHYLGGWLERHNNNAVAFHLDVSQRFDSKDKKAAIKAGRERNQKAIWHIDKKEEISTGGTGT